MTVLREGSKSNHDNVDPMLRTLVDVNDIPSKGRACVETHVLTVGFRNLAEVNGCRKASVELDIAC